MTQKTKSTSGNVLFLILIAVALFAALSYTVTQSSKGGGGGVEQDKLKIKASRIIQYASSIEQAVMRLILINKCSVDQVSFESSSISGSPANPNAPADSSCHVFNSNGGAVPVQAEFFTHAWDQISGTSQVLNVGSSCNNASCSDMTYHIHLGQDKALCEAINKRLNIDTVSGNLPAHDGISLTWYAGTFTHSGRVLGNSAASLPLAGQRTACHFDANNSFYAFYHVVLER